MSDRNFYIKPPKFMEGFFAFFRKWKLEFYKRRKVRREKTPKDRVYFVKFSLNIEDPYNPQEIKKNYEMYVPAKAAYFAKRKAKRAVREKIDLSFVRCEHVTDDELDKLEKSRENYLKKKNREFIENKKESY